MRLPLRLCVAAGAGSAAALVSAQAAPAPPVTQVTPAPISVTQIPGVTVRYYDVTGNNIEALRASIAAQRPRDPATGQPVPSSSTWSIGVSVKKATTGGACKLTGATAALKGEVILPRLANPETVPAAVRTQWQTYATSLEQQQATRLRQVQQRLGEVERAVLASSCEGAGDAANRAIAEITRATPIAPAAPAPAPTR